MFSFPVSCLFLLRRLLTTICFRIFRVIFIIVQQVHWQLNGTASQLRLASNPENYARSAQVVDILFWHKFCELQTITLDDFVYVHNRFENPQFVIDNEHITLFTVNDDYAVFIEADDEEARLWKSQYGASIRYAQLLHGQRLIFVPLTVFHAMSERIGDPNGQLIFTFNVPRSGAALLTKVFEYTGSCVSMYEPESPSYVVKRYWKDGSSQEVQKLARDVIRWECRPYRSFKATAYVIKLNVASTIGLPLFRQLFPDSRALLLYRDIIDATKSTHRVNQAFVSFHLMESIRPFWSGGPKAIFDSLGHYGTHYMDFLFAQTTSVVVAGIQCILPVGFYREQRQRGHVIGAVSYEHLVSRPAENCRLIFEYCQVPSEMAENAVARALKEYSQVNGPLTKENVERIPPTRISAKARLALCRLMLKFALPAPGEQLLLEGTITRAA